MKTNVRIGVASEKDVQKGVQSGGNGQRGREDQASMTTSNCHNNDLPPGTSLRCKDHGM